MVLVTHRDRPHIHVGTTRQRHESAQASLVAHVRRRSQPCLPKFPSPRHVSVTFAVLCAVCCAVCAALRFKLACVCRSGARSAGNKHLLVEPDCSNVSPSPSTVQRAALARQIRAAEFVAVQQTLRQTAPVQLPERLHMTSFAGAIWTPANIRALAEEGYVDIEAQGATAFESRHNSSECHARLKSSLCAH